MKRIKYFIILFICMLLPKNVLAYQLECDNTVIDYNQNLFCHITGENEQNLTLFSGNIVSTDNLISCTPVSYASGLSKIDDSATFVLKGRTQDERLITFSCYLNEKLSEVKRTQIKIEDFKYQFVNDKEIITNETLSSDFISANIYKEEIETDDKPRNTSNPNSLLKVLYEENLNLTFSRFVTIYNQEVLYEVENLDLNVIPNNPNSTIRIVGNGVDDNTNLNVGENIIDIYVRATDGTTTCYTLNVTRLARGEDIYYPEKDATLFSLIIPGYAISFDKDIYEYKVHLTNDVSNLTVNAVPTYDEANVSISSTENLRNGSIIKVSVISKDKSTNIDYIIRITKDAPKANYTTYIVLGVVTVVLIILVVIFIKTSQNKDSNKKVIKNIEQVNNDPNATNNSNAVNIPNNENQNSVSQNINTIDLNNSNAISMKSKVTYDTNINQLSNNMSSIDLNSANVVTPVNINTQNNQGVNNQEQINDNQKIQS